MRKDSSFVFLIINKLLCKSVLKVQSFEQEQLHFVVTHRDIELVRVGLEFSSSY